MPLKNPTNWSNADTKHPTSYTPKTKSPTGWAPADTKTPTSLVVTGKNATGWTPLAEAPVPYHYDSATMTYDSSTVGYDVLDPVMNQLNQKKPTVWSPANV